MDLITAVGAPQVDPSAIELPATQPIDITQLMDTRPPAAAPGSPPPTTVQRPT
ncbi:hypothetical protein J7E25_08470 [Agromyces sp. ISL-38]|uniref:hypothetical protein n=1 Tax=Agromyces sp. ISL-38 TaxID=2819107 RepID=UPI001BE55EBB|nr:hypothetical protein [Agromyces sp. ISL-38]MBT2499129.1 hypothetical protein [Agromyces sp. ISL-38]MBT2518329.1 hypothetical protein [Streptomyces sp. ISL-90]